jgi:hypothetical protein
MPDVAYILKNGQWCSVGWYLKESTEQGRTEGGGVQTPAPKFRSFAKAEPNSQFRGIYVHP